MNSESGQRLSLEELKQRNAQQMQIQTMNPPEETHPTNAEWAEMMDYIYTLTYHAEKQKKIALGHKADDHEDEQTWQQTM